jgi:hypothetical protein
MSRIVDVSLFKMDHSQTQKATTDMGMIPGITVA